MTKKEIVKIFESFNGLKVLVIGDVMVDSYLWGNVERISPEAPVPIVLVKKRENSLGGASNVLKNLHALGAKPIICTVIGDDDSGNIFMELINQLHLNTKAIIKSKHRITTTKLRVMGNNTQMIRVDEEITTDLNSDESKQLLEIINKTLEKEKIDVIIFEDYDKGVITPNLIDSVVTKAAKLNIPIAVDPKNKNFSAYKNVTFFKPNLKEIREGLKIDFDSKDLKKLKKAIDLLHKKFHIETVMTTLSENGVYISKNSNLKYDELIPAHKRAIADVSGAGDTVISVASLCLALKVHPKILASLSNLAGGLVCEKVGAVPIDKNQLLEESLKHLTI